jgi:hypothetical protein
VATEERSAPLRRPEQAPPPKKAGVLQVAATMFWGLCMIGKKDTWEKDGVTVTPLQVVIGGIVTGVVIILALMTLVYFVMRKSIPAS